MVNSTRVSEAVVNEMRQIYSVDRRQRGTANLPRSTLYLPWKTASGLTSEEMGKGGQRFRGWIDSFATGSRGEVERERPDFEKKRAIHRNNVTIVTIIIFLTRGSPVKASETSLPLLSSQNEWPLANGVRT